jgi:NTP pyrophosphatase (non-canonical NTP hydrolase)
MTDEQNTETSSREDAKRPVERLVSQHFNQLTPAEAERLALLMEELGEAQQAIGKILRHGYESTHPDGGPTNRATLEREIGDIQNAIELMIGNNDIDRDEIDSRVAYKTLAAKSYLHHQAG